MATIAASTQPATRFESPASGGHFLSAPGQQPVRAVGDRLATHPGVFGAPGATPSVRGGPVPTAAPASNKKIVYPRPSAARLSMGNGLDLMQAGDAVFLNGKPPFLTSRQQKQVEAASLQRVNALLAGPDGALDINDAATRVRIKEVRVAHYKGELEAALHAAARFDAQNGPDGTTTGVPAVDDVQPGLRLEAARRVTRAQALLVQATEMDVDVVAAPLAYGDYDLQVDWRALPLLHSWHFDGMLVGSNAERDGFDFDTDLLNVAIGGPTPVRNAFGDHFRDELRKTQRFDPRPETGDDAAMLLVHTPEFVAIPLQSSLNVPAKLRFRLVPTTTRQLHPEVLYSGALKTITARDVRNTVGVLRLGRIMDTKKGQTLMLINLASEWRPLSAVFVGDDALDDKARAIVAFVEQGLEIGAADAFNRVLDFLQTYNANVDRGIDFKDMELTEEQTAIAQVLASIAGEGSPSADLIRELEVLQADYVVAMQRRAAAQAAAKAKTKAARQAAAAAATTSGSALSAEALLRAVAESRDAAQQAAAAAIATKETVDRAIEEHLKGINADIEDLKKKEQEEPGWLQQAAEYLDGWKARFIDSDEPYVPFPTRSQSEPAATPTAPPFRSTGAALDADSVRELRERLVGRTLRNDDDDLLDAVLSRADKTALRMHVPIAVRRAQLAHARPVLAKMAPLRAAAAATSASASRSSASASASASAAPRSRAGAMSRR